MTTPLVKNNLLPPGLVSNLQQVFSNRKPAVVVEDVTKNDEVSAQPSSSGNANDDLSKPIILVTNSDGLQSPGLLYLVDALVLQGIYNVHVVAPQSDESTSGHSLSLKKTVEVASVEINGATAYEVSGTPVDCVSLALSGALFLWSKPLLVISGINKGSSCGHHMFYSGVVAGAREALVNGVPSISMSLDWKKDGSQESDFKDAVTVCLPIINAAIRDIEKGIYPKGFSLNVEVPTSPLANKVGAKVSLKSMFDSSKIVAIGDLESLDPSKQDGQVRLGKNWCEVHINVGVELDEELLRPISHFKTIGDAVGLAVAWPQHLGFKVTRQSLWRSTLIWQAISGAKNQAASRFTGGGLPGFGMQFAQLSRDASAAGAARRLTTQKKNLEVVESVGLAGKSDFKRTVKYFRLEMLYKEQEEQDEDLDFRAVENGFVSVTPLSPSGQLDPQGETAVLEWISSALQVEQ